MARSGGISQQLSLDGKDEVVAGFKEIGASGAQAFGQVDKGSKTAAQSLRGFTRELTGVSKSSGRLIRSFSDMGNTVQIIGGLIGGTFGGAAGGLIGFGIAKAVTAMSGSFDVLQEKLIALRDAARGLGVKPIALQALEEASRRAGEGAEVGAKMMAGAADLVQKAATTTKEATGGVAVLRGTGSDAITQTGAAADKTSAQLKNLSGVTDTTVTAFKGGIPVMRDFSVPLGIIGVQLDKFKGTKEGTLQATQAIFQGFQNVAKAGTLTATQLNELSKILFQGLPADAVLATLPTKLQEIDVQIAALQTTARGATDEALARAQKLAEAQGRLGIAWDDLTARFGIGGTTLRIAFDNMLAGFLEALPKWSAATMRWVESTIASLTTAFTDFTNWLSQKFSAIGSTISGVVSAMGAASPAIMPGFAGGGMVRGAGSPTSDSIVARLSAGEFVMRAAAVDHWGAGLLASMNAVAGGLSAPLVPQRGRRGFADGGLVAAGGGTPVHLHLGGSSFALSGSSDVVGALVREAHGQQMRSAGVKPSWYAGRPGGR